MSPRSWRRRGWSRIWPSRPRPRSLGAARSRPRPTGPMPGTCGTCCWRAGCRTAGSRRRRSWRRGRCWAVTTTCAVITRPGCSGSMRCCSTRAPRRARIWARAAGRARLRRGRGRAAVPGRADPGRRRGGDAGGDRGPAGRAAPAAAAAGPAPDGPEGAGRAAVRGRADHRAGVDLLAGRGRPVLLLPQGGPVRRAGHHRVLLGRQAQPGRLSRQGPPVLRWCLYEAGKTHARPSAPDHAYYAAVKNRIDGKRAALSEARKIVRQACTSWPSSATTPSPPPERRVHRVRSCYGRTRRGPRSHRWAERLVPAKPLSDRHPGSCRQGTQSRAGLGSLNGRAPAGRESQHGEKASPSIIM